MQNLRQVLTGFLLFKTKQTNKKKPHRMHYSRAWVHKHDNSSWNLKRSQLWLKTHINDLGITASFVYCISSSLA
jgi:hypothetical protein